MEVPLNRLIDRLAKLPTPIRCSVIGAGSTGRGLTCQLHLTPGFEPVAIADANLQKAIACAEEFGLQYKVVDSARSLRAALDEGKVAVAEDALLVAAAEGVDILMEATGDPYGGAMHARTAIAHGQHVVTMNHETEAMYGPVLLREAKANGVVYTCSDGDQPAVITALANDILLWGFQLVMCGNIKGFLDRYTNPTKIAPEADKRQLDHKMCSAYTDGSKLCVEMVAVANGHGGRVFCPGMLGPRMQSVDEIFDHFDFGSMWKPGDAPYVDYILGARPFGGIFVIGYHDHPFQQFSMSWFPSQHGMGPFYLFYRPYHLVHFESVRTAAEAYLDGSTRLAAEHGIRTNVFAYAKRDLSEGEELDGMGGYNTYGLIENVGDAGGGTNASEAGVPQLISGGMRVKRAFRKDERIPLSEVRYDASAPAFELYMEALRLGRFASDGTASRRGDG